MDLDWWDEKVSGLFVTIRIKWGGGRGDVEEISAFILSIIYCLFFLIIIIKKNKCQSRCHLF